MQTYDPTHRYGHGENIPPHGGHKKRKGHNGDSIAFSGRGAPVAGTGKPAASSDRKAGTKKTK